MQTRKEILQEVPQIIVGGSQASIQFGEIKLRIRGSPPIPRANPECQQSTGASIK
jgi:hypothetical protein